MGLFDRLILSLFALITLTAFASIFLISFDNDHNQQAPVDNPPTPSDDTRPAAPVPSTDRA